MKQEKLTYIFLIIILILIVLIFIKVYRCDYNVTNLYYNITSLDCEVLKEVWIPFELEDIEPSGDVIIFGDFCDEKCRKYNLIPQGYLSAEENNLFCVCMNYYLK